MGSDRARRSYDAGRMYRSVVSQQGRVTVEADANEAEEIRADESRAELIDVVGPAGSPDDGFKIAVPGAGRGSFDFGIGKGTLYVGGMRVHQDEDGATYLGQQKKEWVDYPARVAEQYPENTAPFTEAVYLTVTEQEICAVEDEALREVALGGPDTAARTRLIQCVHRLPVANADCEGAFAAVLKKVYSEGALFDPATQRLESRIRLKVDYAPGPDKADDCQPTAQAGFLGPENQLIRVRVNGPGTMLWGWDNASVLYRVELKSPTTLKLQGIPVDLQHHPRPNQWAELMGTAVNLGEDARVASPVGAAVQVQDYDPDSRTVTLKTAVATDFLATHPLPLFLRMWENRFDFAPDETTPVELRDSAGAGTGVRVYAQGKPVVAGDYWTIGVRPNTPQAILPARLAKFQPPDGPKRWVTPLAVIAWHDDLKTADVTDCRPPFLDLVELTRRRSGSCELVVAPGEDIQAAINSLPPEGGSVCLKAGVHRIGAPIRLDRSWVTLHGESAGTVVEAPPPAPPPPAQPPVAAPVPAPAPAPAPGAPFAAMSVLMLEIGHPEQPLADIVVQDIHFVVNGAVTGVGGAFVRIARCARAHIRRCRFVSETAAAELPFFGAIAANECSDLTVAENDIEGMFMGVVAAQSTGQLGIRRNAMRGLSSADYTMGSFGILLLNTSLFASARIEENQLEHCSPGILLGANLDGSSIVANTVRRGRSPSPTGPIAQVAQSILLMQYLDARIHAIVCASNECEIRANRIDLRSAWWGGIRTVGRHTLVEANVIEALAIPDQEVGRPSGIYCTAALEGFQGAHHALVRDNVLTGPQAAITIVRCYEVEVSRNHIDGERRAWYGVRMHDVVGTVVKDNEIRDISTPDVSDRGALYATEGHRNRFEGNRIRGCRMGILARHEVDVAVSRNWVEGAGEVGIWVLYFHGSAAICGNRVANCGFETEQGRGISADAWLAEGAESTNLLLQGCEVIDTGISPDGKSIAARTTAGITGTLFSCELVGNRVGYSNNELLDPANANLALSLLGPPPTGDNANGRALVSDNAFSGRCQGTLVMIWEQGTTGRRFGRVTFSNNVCYHLDATPSDTHATVLLSSDHLIVMGNQVEAPNEANSFNLADRPEVALMGNVTTGGFIHLDDLTVVPRPFTSFNVRG